MILDQARQEGWAGTGVVHLRGVIDPTVADALVDWVEEVAAWSNDPAKPGLHHREQTDAGPVLARSEYFADAHESLGRFIRHDEVIVEVLTGLFGQPPVLFKEKINYKHPGGGGFAPHQDATAYRFVDHHISVMVPIDPATEASGCLWFADALPAGELATDGRGRIAPDVVDALSWHPVEVQPGDLVFFDSYAPHRSDTNTTDRPRRVLYLTYNAQSDGDLRERYYRDKLAEFAGADGTFDRDRVRMSINDDFLGRPVVQPDPIGTGDQP
ncbi:MAG: phytanoyl-CoA dioxygenase family protein [Actinomycetota bacterium]